MAKYLISQRYVIDTDKDPNAMQGLSACGSNHKYFHDEIVKQLTDEEYDELLAEAKAYEEEGLKAEKQIEEYLRDPAQV